MDWKATPCVEGELKLLNDRLAKLPAAVLWDDRILADVPQSGQYVMTRQEVFWLRLIQCLKDGRDRQAALLLRNNPFFENSWAPNLESALKHVLNVRLKGEHKFFADIPAIKGKNVHVFFQTLQDKACLLYTSPSPRDGLLSRMPSSA